MSSLNSRLAIYAPQMLSILRIAAALIFLAHGTGKLLGFPILPSAPAMMSLSWFGGFVELIGGVLLLLGLFTPIAAFLMSGEMAVAYFSSHFPRSFFPVLNGGDAAALFCFVFLYFVFAGPGPWSVDALRNKA